MATSMQHQQNGSGEQGHDESADSDQAFTPQEKRRFPALVLAGLALGLVSILLAWIILGIEYGLPLLLLALILVVAGVGFRLITGRNRDEADSEEGGLPTQSPDPRRPVGDTAEAHDEINPHDFPLYNPGRRTAQRMAGGEDDTTRGTEEGAAAGAGGSAEGHGHDVAGDEGGGASLETSTGPKD